MFDIQFFNDQTLGIESYGFFLSGTSEFFFKIYNISDKEREIIEKTIES